MITWTLQSGIPSLNMIESQVITPGVSFVVNPKFLVVLGSTQSVFNAKDPEEQAYFTFDCSRWLAPTETILTALFEISLAEDSKVSDPDYLQMLSGSAHVIDGLFASQQIISGIVGANYDIVVTFSTTLDGQNIYQVLKGKAECLVETY